MGKHIGITKANEIVNALGVIVDYKNWVKKDKKKVNYLVNK